jgi:dienelactone hydrolase
VCFELDSLPPIPVLSGGAVAHEDLGLQAQDGNRLAAFAALPDEPAKACVVILPDVRGLYRFYEELALRFAERGYAAVAIDYFGRTAGIEKRDDDFDYVPHVEQATKEGVQADVGAAVTWLREHGCKSVFTVGFCSAGAIRGSLLQATTAFPARSASTADQGRSRTGHRGQPNSPTGWKRRSSRSKPVPTSTSPPRTTSHSTKR